MHNTNTIISSFYSGTEEEFKKMIAEKTKQAYMSDDVGFNQNCDADEIYKIAYEEASLDDTDNTYVSYDKDYISYVFHYPSDVVFCAQAIIRVDVSCKELNGNDKLTRVR